MITTPPIMLKAPYSSLSLLFGPLNWAHNYLQHILSLKKTKRKISWCSGLCPSPLVGFMRSLVRSWIVCWDDCSPCALSFASLVIFIATWSSSLVYYYHHLLLHCFDHNYGHFFIATIGCYTSILLVPTIVNHNYLWVLLITLYSNHFSLVTTFSHKD